ncbi:hypothetical protein BIFGAL_02655 [Bifidobacterium gallicum DSM 20093 = LMG 11596]|uniref:Uncharacterized protein n=1 Tax=Bifidobacterium gallicum DSM 20093 = LMG 11596 TaxID=561180 RepID=D1NS99_9BIFI|nr:hypothetical protein BIFGAL_02655 [Bifidobacterium gallicum DSM 20093 = LMG 11596]
MAGPSHAAFLGISAKIKHHELLPSTQHYAPPCICNSALHNEPIALYDPQSWLTHGPRICNLERAVYTDSREA